MFKSTVTLTRLRLALLLTLAVVGTAGALIALRPADPLAGRWVVVHTTKNSALQFNVSSMREDARGQSIWIRDDFINDSTGAVVTFFSKVEANCGAGTVKVAEVIAADVITNKSITIQPDPNKITTSTYVTYTFLCPLNPLSGPQFKQPEVPAPEEQPTRRPRLMMV
jgi:hypothetical protein